MDNSNKVRQNFINDLERVKYIYKVEGDRIFVSGDKYGITKLPGTRKLPENVTFEGRSTVELCRLEEIPAGTEFRNSSSVYISEVTYLPEDVEFLNAGAVSLYSVVTIPAGFRFENKGGVSLKSLKYLPEGILFYNGGYLELHSLLTLPRYFTLGCGGRIYLRDFSEEPFLYRGKLIRVKSVDEQTMVILSEKKVGDYTVMKCSYFGGGELEDWEGCYIAQKGKFYAHGATLKEAMEDVDFKFLQSKYNVYSLVDSIKNKGFVTVNDYRMLTGACKEGCRRFLKENNAKEEMSIPDAVKFVDGAFGGKRFIELLTT